MKKVPWYFVGFLISIQFAGCSGDKGEKENDQTRFGGHPQTTIETPQIVYTTRNLDCSIVLPFSGARQFRNTGWGMTVEQVICSDSLAVFSDIPLNSKVRVLNFESKILECKYEGKYLFDNNQRLDEIFYEFSFISDECFLLVVAALNDKYGKFKEIPVYGKTELEAFRWEDGPSFITLTTKGMGGLAENAILLLKEQVRNGKDKSVLRDVISHISVSYAPKEMAVKRDLDAKQNQEAEVKRIESEQEIIEENARQEFENEVDQF